ncbi:iron-containing alcohol dehydrogenase [Facklamia miroungae]|uniref:NADP-dependent alcohol dehydrogenase n=1 Tax=Facklamia miroungae TaxID=120956 RepID=A0A1G7QHS8_9LACT|nr:iron-containing alcohol dehydrogenase [Facklamia miroungae]SDF98073.1 NADP-dependent alcohol dehydrogenase [Facklamia miroungae]
MTINNFTFYNPTRILFGKGQIESIDRSIPKDAKVLITYGGGSIKKFGTFDKIVTALGERQWDEFGGIEPNPYFETLMKAVKKIKEEGFDFILAAGGGSVIDGTKFIAAAAAFEGDPIDIFSAGIGQGLPIKKALPFGTILTLPATSSEMNAGGVITIKEKNAKVSFGSVHTYPQFSVLDPELTYTLPQRQLANGISDTFVHILENYLNQPVGAILQDGWSETALKGLIQLAPQLKEDNHDYDVRSNFMWICTNGLNGFMSQGLPTDWSTHKLGHEITAFNHTDHARTLTPIILATMEVRWEEKFAKLVQYAENVWNIHEGSDQEKAQAAIQATRKFFQSINMPVTLEEIDVEAKDIDYLVDQLIAHEFTEIGEHKTQTPEVSRAIYEKALN